MYDNEVNCKKKKKNSPQSLNQQFTYSGAWNWLCIAIACWSFSSLARLQWQSYKTKHGISEFWNEFFIMYGSFSLMIKLLCRIFKKGKSFEPPPFQASGRTVVYIDSIIPWTTACKNCFLSYEMHLSGISKERDTATVTLLFSQRKKECCFLNLSYLFGDSHQQNN